MRSTLFLGAAPKLPKSTASVAIPSAATATAGAAITFTQGQVGSYVTLYPSAKVRIRCGETYAAATAGDFPLNATTHYSFQIQADTLKVVGYGDGAAATLYYSITSH